MTKANCNSRVKVRVKKTGAKRFDLQDKSIEKPKWSILDVEPQKRLNNSVSLNQHKPENTRNRKSISKCNYLSPVFSHPFVVYKGTDQGLSILKGKHLSLVLPDGCEVKCFVTSYTVYIKRNQINNDIYNLIKDLDAEHRLYLVHTSGIREVDLMKSTKPNKKQPSKFKGVSTFNISKSRKTYNNVFQSVRCPGARNPVRLWH